MAKQKKTNLSEYDPEKVPGAAGRRFVLLVAEWNEEITFALRDGAYNTLMKNGANKEDIHVLYVPGSFELPSAAAIAAETVSPDAIICIGCVIQGETRHFEFINNAVADGITKVSIDNEIPVIYGVLTPDNWEQAKDRAGGKHGNKGVEAAVSAMKMIDLKEEMFLIEEKLYPYEFGPFLDDDDDDDEWDDDPFDEGPDDDSPKLN